MPRWRRKRGPLGKKLTYERGQQKNEEGGGTGAIPPEDQPSKHTEPSGANEKPKRRKRPERGAQKAGNVREGQREERGAHFALTEQRECQRLRP
jgi:hypothetical protein